MKQFLAIAWRPVILVLSVVVLFSRAPSVLWEPRLLAEEGTIYFARAYQFAHTWEWYRGLTITYVGYYALWPSLATTIAANLFPLEYVPRVTMTIALVVHLIPIAPLLWAPSDFWSSPLKRIAGVLVILFVPISGEIWLSSITSQFIFPLIPFLILHADTAVSKTVRWTYRVLLMCAGLSGILSCFLVPWFVLKAWSENTRERWIQLGVFGACALFQVICVLIASSEHNSMLPERSGMVEWQTVVAIAWTQSIGLVLFGFQQAEQFSKVIFSAFNDSMGISNLLAVTLLAAEVSVIFFLSSSFKRRDAVTTVGSYLVLLIMSVLGGLSGSKQMLIYVGYAQRYFYSPNIILMLIVIFAIQLPTSLTEAKKQWNSGLLLAVLLLSLFWGLRQFHETTIADDSWPRWSEQVAMWRKDPQHPIEVWPPGWSMPLTKRVP